MEKSTVTSAGRIKSWVVKSRFWPISGPLWGVAWTEKWSAWNRIIECESITLLVGITSLLWTSFNGVEAQFLRLKEIVVSGSVKIIFLYTCPRMISRMQEYKCLMIKHIQYNQPELIIFGTPSIDRQWGFSRIGVTYYCSTPIICSFAFSCLQKSLIRVLLCFLLTPSLWWSAWQKACLNRNS